MEFGWVALVIICVIVYAVVCWEIKKRNFHPEIFAFMGPCLMVRTSRTGIFDVLARFRRTFLVYGTLGVVVVVACSVLMTVMIIVTAYLTMLIQPDPSPIIQPQNLLLIPGVNDFVPSTFAVWFALVFAVVIHEFGHGLLSRVEKIRVKYTGILALVIPIGAFVEPDEEEIEKSPLATKLRMFAAGITNNLVVGAICILALILLLGMVVPGTVPFVQGVYEGYPADLAGMQPGTVILAIDGVPVANTTDISTLLAGTIPGQTIQVLGEYKGVQQMYDITLTSVPPDITGSSAGNTTSGFMGVLYGDPQAITDTLHAWTHPETLGDVLVSALNFLVLPFSSLAGSSSFGMLVTDTPDPAFLSAPFDGFWEIIHVLYWCAWVNILLGTFNALPIGPLDGGQMLREGVKSFLAKRGKEEYALPLCSVITNLLIVVIIIPIIMPYFFR
ncbi:MAG TPA: site-2 protease family protein [Methanocorpusculum sp.]|nr:site-2 protease family protein [Methanocorpusculum sp.]HJK21687.1 site-2 protease family protein [Methanocorpusculum sp.]HJK26496.1 site-2 protease family protein [Methanocorpusculum sp.]HJK29329.1 site-2 protease family protein [Methanocorpusculum sp.]HJK29759.1 site-2 protease family protein [Methanocorpusculum sp.]